MYERNFTELKKMRDEGALLWPPERHKNAAGEYNLAENMAIWNNAVARLESIPLWAQGSHAPPSHSRTPPASPQ